MAQKKKLVGHNVITIMNALFKNLHRNKVNYFMQVSLLGETFVLVERWSIRWHTVPWMQVRSIIFCQMWPLCTI